MLAKGKAQGSYGITSEKARACASRRFGVGVVMTRGRKNWGIEVKAAASVTSRDGRGLARLADQCGKDFERGILFYEGRDMLPLTDKRMLAVPLSELWER